MGASRSLGLEVRAGEWGWKVGEECRWGKSGGWRLGGKGLEKSRGGGGVGVLKTDWEGD